MTFQYVSVDEAIKRSGVRMVVVGGVPSPWGEAAKGILHVKNIEWAAVRLVYDSEPLKEWAGQRSGPILIYNNERPRAGWAEILLLSERLAPNPSLLPKDAADRALVFGLAHEICGEQGLAWSRRLQLIHAGLNNKGGFPERVSKYLGKKYGYSPEAGANSGSRVADVLRMLASRLKEQRQAGNRHVPNKKKPPPSNGASRRSCAKPTHGCGYGACAKTRPAGAARVAAATPINAARASPSRDGHGSITSSRRCARERRRRTRSKPRTKRFSDIASDASCAGPTCRTGTTSSSCSSPTAAG
jgi:hypothetical protein